MTPKATPPIAVIGSNARDVPEFLREAIDVCLRLAIVPVMVTHPAAGDLDANGTALGLVDEADVYIGIFGRADRHVPAGGDKSIVEMEYDRAVERGIPTLVFTTSCDRPPQAAVAETVEHAANPEAFIDRIRGEQFVRHVSTPEELRELLHDGLVESGIRGKTGRLLRPPPVEPRPRQKGGGDGRAKTAVPKTTPAKKHKEIMRVFVASPRDVQEERSRMPKVIASLNRTLGKLLNVTVELWRWEVDAPPALGEPQALIDPELDQADVVLVIFWNRFGTPDSAGTTGTESEVLRALERWNKARRPQVMIYFCQRPARLERTELEQRLRLLDFKDRIASLTLAVDYEAPEEFEWRVRDDLFLNIAGMCVKHR